MKKITALLLVCIMLIAFVACGDAGKTPPDDGTTSTTTGTTTKKTDVPVIPAGQMKVEIKDNKVISTVNDGAGNTTLQEYVYKDGKISEINVSIECPSAEIAAYSYNEMIQGALKENTEKLYFDVKLNGSKIEAKFKDDYVMTFAGISQEELKSALEGNYPPQGGEFTSETLVTSATEPEFYLFDFDEMMSGQGKTKVLSKMSSKEKSDLLSQAEAENITVTFHLDGSTTLTNDEGDKAVQKSDGTWTFVDADGGEGQMGGEWPDNEYTRLVPKPSFGIVMAGVDNAGFGAVFTTDTTKADIMAYAAKLKAAGFNIDVEELDLSEYGMDMYSFLGKNAAGYTCEIMFGSENSSLGIYKD